MANLGMLLKRRFWEYPQTWYFMPRWRPLRRLLQRLHGYWGHQISNTEWGYGGGDFIDCNCRWCDASIQVPIAEARKRFQTLRKMEFEGFLEPVRGHTSTSLSGEK